jgi:hypothetical protein
MSFTSKLKQKRQMQTSFTDKLEQKKRASSNSVAGFRKLDEASNKQAAQAIAEAEKSYASKNTIKETALKALDLLNRPMYAVTNTLTYLNPILGREMPNIRAEGYKAVKKPAEKELPNIWQSIKQGLTGERRESPTKSLMAMSDEQLARAQEQIPGLFVVSEIVTGGLQDPLNLPIIKGGKAVIGAIRGGKSAKTAAKAADTATDVTRAEKAFRESITTPLPKKEANSLQTN